MPTPCGSPAGRGRDAGYPTPPARIRAGAPDAHGSYLGSDQRAACYAGTSIDHCLPTRSARCPVRDRRTDVLLGQRPSLHDLLRPSLAFVRPLRRYYAAVRLPAAVHVGLIAHRFHPPIRQSMTADGNRVLPRPLKGTVGSVLAREVSIHAWGLRLRSAGETRSRLHVPRVAFRLL